VGAGVIVDADAKGFLGHGGSPYGSVVGAAGLPTGWRQRIGRGVADRPGGRLAGRRGLIEGFVRQAAEVIKASRLGDSLSHGCAKNRLHDSPFRTLRGVFLLLAKQCGDQFC